MQVQNTNDSSIVSKLSSSERGYFEDTWLNMFVKKSQRRSPIINRGYYIRFKAIEATFRAWHDMISRNEDSSQIISLGAGFDTSYFRLKSTNLMPAGCKYIEVDYPEVMKRKLDFIQSCKLSDSFEDIRSDNKECPHLVASNEDYIMLGLDLKDYEALESAFQVLHIDYSLPTLFLSECAVTYMDLESSNGLIKWIQSHFSNSAFVTYEQVCPSDGFGIVMQNHFKNLSCPLKSLPTYPDKKSQYSRYSQMGWSSCSFISMFQFFTSFADEEKCRIRNIELFDEYEMWHEKCHHYLLIWAAQGNVSTPKMFQLKNTDHSLKSSINSLTQWQLSSTPVLLQRFGHQVALLSSRFLIVSGGFGHLEKRHQRLGGLFCYDVKSETCNPILISDPLDLLGKRMFHTMTALSNGRLILIGGRSSPANVFNKVVEIKCQNVPFVNEENSLIEKAPFYLKETTVMPVPTWRHSASTIEISGSENVFLFGGSSSQNNATNNCYLLNTDTWEWLEIPRQCDTPSPRHSHSSVSISKSKVALTCGLTENETILSSLHVFDSECSKWGTMVIPGLLPRYSHASHFWNDRIFLVGGITSISGYSLSIGIIHLDSLTALEFSCPAQDPEYPMMLSNHCSYICEDKITITGGGGNCFSFGTHFNQKSVVIDLKELQKTWHFVFNIM